MPENPPIHRVAHHEAAHTIVSHLMGLPVDYVEVHEDTDEIRGGGVCMHRAIPFPEEYTAQVWQAVVWTMNDYAGRFASERLGSHESVPFTESSDFKDSLPNTLILGESIEGQRLIAHAVRMTRIVVNKLWPLIDSLAIELSEKGRLDGDYLQQRLTDLVGPCPPLH